MELDVVDRTILSHLRADSKTQIKDIAKELKMHPNTLLQRVRKLEKNGIIRGYITDINFGEAGYDLHLIISMKIRSGKAGDMEQLKDLLAIKEFEAIYAASGNWDVIALTRVKNRAHMLDVVHRLGEHEIVVQTNTSIILHEYKRPAQYNPFL
ncbi:MAG: Lrp/AsnC family transcriptional regulator [Candidatus Micrarchaeota archaeon]